jgi:hypothetical protein
MDKEVIFALVLAALFLGAIAWLVVYSRLQHRGDARQERRPMADEPEVTESRRGRMTRQSRAR